jgi:hypothetical protein
MPGMSAVEYRCDKCGVTTMIPYMMKFKPVDKETSDRIMEMEWHLAILQFLNTINEIEICNRLEAEINKLAFEDCPPEINKCPQCGALKGVK